MEIMKYLIISDIHGDSGYLKLVLSKVEFDKLIILGDILYHGPRNNLPNEYNPKEVVEILNRLKEKIIAVRGNCDANVDLMVLDFKINNHLNIKLNNKKFFLTHGDVYNKDNLPFKIGKYTIIYGHFHKNEVNHINKVTTINVGSLSIPKDNHHSYSVYEDNVFTSYDLLTDEVLLKEIID